MQVQEVAALILPSQQAHTQPNDWQSTVGLWPVDHCPMLHGTVRPPPSMCRPAAIHWQGRVGDGLCRVGRQEHGQGADLGSLGEAFHAVTKLAEFGIRDRNLWRLQQLVGDEVQSGTTSQRSDAAPLVEVGLRA